MRRDNSTTNSTSDDDVSDDVSLTFRLADSTESAEVFFWLFFAIVVLYSIMGYWARLRDWHRWDRERWKQENWFARSPIMFFKPRFWVQMNEVILRICADAPPLLLGILLNQVANTVTVWIWSAGLNYEEAEAETELRTYAGISCTFGEDEKEPEWWVRLIQMLTVGLLIFPLSNVLFRTRVRQHTPSPLHAHKLHCTIHSFGNLN